eukprot:TRINITY_DN376_c0_g1_i1.p1 TRINITY_DN376_c0_g1~~TRINITY_DN376_c0_g1_i1.p1  ORF type:complete len:299 (-),score=83.92 TRINITY_DN376_c0_g1_i1:88-984(-)
MSATDSQNANTSGVTYYPGSAPGFFAAGTFYLVWGLGIYMKGIIYMMPGVKKLWEQRVCRGRKIPFEGLYLSILGYCAFFGQMGQANWQFYDKDSDNYVNQNNLLMAVYFLALGMAGTTMCLTARYGLNKYFENGSLIFPNVVYIIAMSFKSMQDMTTLDWIILVLSLITFGVLVAGVLADTFVNSHHTRLLKSFGLMFIGVWFYQVYTIYWGKDNRWQERSFAVEYAVNVFFVELLIVTWFFGLAWFFVARSFEGLLAEARAHHVSPKNQRKLPLEEEISKSSDNIDIELLANKPIA